MSFCEIRYRRGASGVRNMHSVQKAGSWCTRGVFKGTRCKKQASTVPKGNSVLKKGFWCTEVIFGTGESLLVHRTQLQKRETASCCTGRSFKSAKTASARRRANIKEGDQKVFCSPSYGLPNPRRLTSATPIRGISRLRCGPFGTFGSPLLIWYVFTLRPIRP